MSMVQTLASKLTLTPDLSPVDRDRNYKGRIKQIFSTLSQHPVKGLLVSLMGTLFWAPLIAVFLFVLPYIINSVVLSGYNFTGSLGIGYSASSAEYIGSAIRDIYTTRIQYTCYYLLPSIMFASIGMAGVYNCMRNLLWDVECNILKTFFLGIKRHWYKFLIVYTVLGALALGFVTSLLEIRMAYAMGISANAGWWVLLIFSGILALLAAVYSMILVPMLVTYKYDKVWYKNLGICLKNSAIIVCISPLQILIVTIIVALPLALTLIPAVSTFMVIVIALYGIAFYALLDIAYSQFYCDNYIYFLYNKNQEEAKKQQAKEAKAYRQQQAKEKQAKISYKKKKK